MPAVDISSRRLYLCTPDRPDLQAFVAACIRGGVDIVQLRDNSLTARATLERAPLAKQVCNDMDVPFVVNDRPDIALEVGADGVHVGQDDAPPTLCRRILGDRAIVGRSTHARDELAAAADEPVDYVSAGPVMPTPSKPGRPGTGVEYLVHAAQHARHPFFVTGGVNPETVGPMLEAGARRFVVARWLTESDDPERAARAVRQVIDRYND